MRFLMVFVAFIVTTLPAFAGETVLGASADAFVCDCAPGTTNPGFGTSILCQGQPFGTCYDRLFIKFDMADIPEGVTITAAELELLCYSYYGSPSGEMTYTLIIEDWNEHTVTHNDSPADSSDIETVTGWPSTGNWHIVDATEFVQAWYGGTRNNYGIHGHSRNTTGQSMSAFYSSNYSSASYHPRLVVHYSGSAVDNASLGETKAAFK